MLLRPQKINFSLILYGSFFIVCVALFVYVRTRHKDIAFERDEGEYTYAAQEILRGKIPYRDFYNMKTPLVYYSFALLFKLFGDSVHTVKMSLLFVNLISALFIFLTARKLFGRDTGLVAGGIFLLFCLSYAAQGWTANAEHFVILFASMSLFYLTRDIRRRKLVLRKISKLQSSQFNDRPPKSKIQNPNSHLFISGAFMMLAFLCKQQAIGFLFFPIIWLISCHISAVGSRRRLNRLAFIFHRSFFMKILAYCMGCATPLVILVLYLWTHGALNDFYYLCVQYAQAYGNIYPTFGEIANFQNIFNDNKWFWMMVLGYFFMTMTGKMPEKHAGFLFLLFFCCFYSVCLGFLFRPHYFQLIFPACAMMAAFFVVRLSTKPYVPMLFLSAAFYFMVKEQKGYFYKNSPDQITQRMYGTHYFTVKRDLALELPQHVSDKNKPICVIGHEPEIFFYAHLRSASGFLYLYPALESQPYAQQMADKFIRETETANPEILIYFYDTLPSQNPVTSAYLKTWFDNYKENYHAIGQIYVDNDVPKIEWQTDTSKNFKPKDIYYALVYQKNK